MEEAPTFMKEAGTHSLPRVRSTKHSHVQESCKSHLWLTESRRRGEGRAGRGPNMLCTKKKNPQKNFPATNFIFPHQILGLGGNT